MSNRNHSYRRSENRRTKRHAISIVLLSFGAATLSVDGVLGTHAFGKWDESNFALPAVPASNTVATPAVNPTQSVIQLRTPTSAPRQGNARPVSTIRLNPYMPAQQTPSEILPVAAEDALDSDSNQQSRPQNSHTLRMLQPSTMPASQVERSAPVLLKPTAKALVLRQVHAPGEQPAPTQFSLSDVASDPLVDESHEVAKVDRSDPMSSPTVLAVPLSGVPIAGMTPDDSSGLENKIAVESEGAIETSENTRLAFSDETETTPLTPVGTPLIVAAAPLLESVDSSPISVPRSGDDSGFSSEIGAVQNNRFADTTALESQPSDTTSPMLSTGTSGGSKVPQPPADFPTASDAQRLGVSPTVPRTAHPRNSGALPAATVETDRANEPSSAMASSGPAPRLARPSKRLVIEVPQAPATAPAPTPLPDPIASQATATLASASSDVKSVQSSKTGDEKSIFTSDVNQYVSVEAGQTRDIHPTKSVRRVELQNREVCDAVLVGQHRLLLIGRTSGETRMAVWCDDESQPTIYALRVANTPETPTSSSLEAVAARLTDTISATYPNCRIRVVSTGDALSVRGTANNDKSAREVMRLVRSACLKTVYDELSVR